MPDQPDPKPQRPTLSPQPRNREEPPYVELHCKTNFSFLEGASHPDELVQQAAVLGYHALAITDKNSLAGVVRAHVAARSAELKLLIGAEITLTDAPPAVLLATDRDSYGRLCRLLTIGKRRAPKGECQLTFEDLTKHSQGLLACVLLRPGLDFSPALLLKYRKVFGDRCYGLLERHFDADDSHTLEQMLQRADTCDIPVAAANNVHYHIPRRRLLHDTLTAIRHRCRISELGTRRFSNGERYLKSPSQMRDLFSDLPDAVFRTKEIADRCQFSLDELRYEYPEELCPSGITRIQYLRNVTEVGARERYPQGVPEKVRKILEHEFELIEKLQYESYFLTVWDLVNFARSQNILCQGRGSAANSAVCYCLGVTSVNPDQIDVLFERFISEERNEAPDIDVDFEHDRREIVLQYLYKKYGRDRAGLTATVITYRPKSAVRDVGKALGFSLDRLNTFAKSADHIHDPELLSQRLEEAGLNSQTRLSRQFLFLVQEILGFPRHLSQHVGGMIITQRPLCEMAPIENASMPGRTVICWDKDDLDMLGILKIDCLALGMLSALHRSFDLLKKHYDQPLTLAAIPPDDPAVYAMIRKADTIGVFQIESRAQMSSLPLLRPEKWYDLVIQVAIIRPGPIQGDMVHPYRRRKNGEEEVSYPDERIKGVLHKTLGVPLFQEQAMRLAIVAAGFTPGEADQLRRAMAAWRRTGNIDQFRIKLINGLIANGYDQEFGERLFHMIRGFGQYGFPESHAASFARLAYASAWLKYYYPEVFTASLLNSQPMGFYGPSQLVRDARQHGVEVRGVDVNESEWNCTLEFCPSVKKRPYALRLGFRLIKGFAEAHAQKILSQRSECPFSTFNEFALRTRLSKPVLERLSKADAFRSLGLNRRDSQWQSIIERPEQPLLDQILDHEPEVALPQMTPYEEVTHDYRTTGLSLKTHPMKFLRPTLDRDRILSAEQLREASQDAWVKVAGLVILRQRPSTSNGVTFVTLEDETGLVNLIVPQSIWERHRRIARNATVLHASGPLQKQKEVIHVLARHLKDFSHLLQQIEISSRDFH